MALRFTARREEIPGDLPPLDWYKRVLRAEETGAGAALPYYSPELEYLSPPALARVRAKVWVWVEVTGEMPRDLSMWGEIRKARKYGCLPHLTRVRQASIEGEVMRCGFCRSRYSQPWPDRCNACDTKVGERHG